MIIGCGFIYLGLPVVLPEDVHDHPSRTIGFPIIADADLRKEWEGIRVWFSDDCGRTWKLHASVQATASQVFFAAPRDGQYWFTLQTAYKNGKFDPATLDDPKEIAKVYANANRLPVIRPKVVAKSSLPRSPMVQEPNLQQLHREISDLRSIVEELRKRTAELEKERKHK